MKRGIAFGAFVAAGVLTIGAAGYQAQPEGPKTVRLRTLGPGDDLYLLLGGGGNTLAMTRDDGTVLVDTKQPGWGHAIADAVNDATDRPVTTIINTNPQIDHVGGNVEFPTATEIIAHANAKTRMQMMPAFAGSNAKFLPNKTVTDKMTLFSGRDQIDLYYFGAGHTDGDLVVVFPAKRIADFGDLFPSKAAPMIDVASGGSGVAFPQTLARAIAEIKGVNRVITGHEEGVVARRDPRALSVDISTPNTMAWADVQEYADFNRDFLAAVREAIAAGKSADQAAAALKLDDRYKNYDMTQAKANVAAIYGELKK